MAASLRTLLSRQGQLLIQYKTAPVCSTCVLMRTFHSNSAAKLQAQVAEARQYKQVVTLLPGDGVWPELMEVVRKVFKSGGIPVEFEELNLSEVTPYYSNTMEDVVGSIKKNGICLKGIMAAANVLDKGMLENVNMTFRNELDLFANVVLVKSIPGLKSRHGELDFVIIREQTEGEYSALEHESVKGVVECLKIVTKAKSKRIAKFAFDYATRHNRQKVTAVHKANIMKLGDGLFLESCKEVAELYPKIKFESMIVDNCCMQLVSNPHQFDVMVTPNLYGNIIDNIGAGLAGGAGVIPGESYSPEVAVFEPGARHSFGQAAGRNIANPTAILLCASNMLRHMNLEQHANRIQSAVYNTIQMGKVRTRDMGGYSSTLDYTLAIIDNMHV